MYMKRAIELKRMDYTHFQIAQTMHVEFNMERRPAISTVSYWLDALYRHTDEEMKRVHCQFRAEQFEQLERLKSKWLKIAMAQDLEIQRWINTKGGKQPTIEENAINEQLKATEAIVKIMARQARLLGLDVERAGPQVDGAQDRQEMQLWIIRQISMMGVAPAEGSKMESGREVLELTSGIEELEDPFTAQDY
jgi:hypothetical protein